MAFAAILAGNRCELLGLGVGLGAGLGTARGGAEGGWLRGGALRLGASPPERVLLNCRGTARQASCRDPKSFLHRLCHAHLDPDADKDETGVSLSWSESAPSSGPWCTPCDTGHSQRPCRGSGILQYHLTSKTCRGQN